MKQRMKKAHGSNVAVLENRPMGTASALHLLMQALDRLLKRDVPMIAVYDVRLLKVEAKMRIQRASEARLVTDEVIESASVCRSHQERLRACA